MKPSHKPVPPGHLRTGGDLDLDNKPEKNRRGYDRSAVARQTAKNLPAAPVLNWRRP